MGWNYRGEFAITKGIRAARGEKHRSGVEIGNSRDLPFGGFRVSSGFELFDFLLEKIQFLLQHSAIAIVGGLSHLLYHAGPIHL